MTDDLDSLRPHPKTGERKSRRYSRKHVRVLWHKLADAKEEIAQLRESYELTLQEPVAVYMNMMFGGIAKPTLRQIFNLYGEDAIVEELEKLKSKRAKAALRKGAVR